MKKVVYLHYPQLFIYWGNIFYIKVQEQMSKMARSTNAAKVSIGWEATEGGYFEVVYYIKKPRNK